MINKKKIFIFLIILFLINGCKEERTYINPITNRLEIAKDRYYDDSTSIIADQLIILNQQLSQLLKQKEE